MRLNSARRRNISPEHLLGFKLQINEEDDTSSRDDAYSPEINANKN